MSEPALPSSWRQISSDNGMTWLQTAAMQQAGVSHAFTTHLLKGTPQALSFGGAAEEAEVVANEHRLCEALCFGSGRLARARQVHGRRVLRVTESPDLAALRRDEADALVTVERGVLLAIATADCVPVLFADPQGVIGAAHAGWRGIVAGVLEATIERMVELGALPQRLQVAVGPHIGPRAYEVGTEVAAHFSHEADVVHVGDAGTRTVDLGRAVVCAIKRCGVDAARIAYADHCTFAQPELFFSYRREGPASGRQLSVVGLASE